MEDIVLSCFFSNKTHLSALWWGQVRVRIRVWVQGGLRHINLKAAFLDVASGKTVSGLDFVPYFGKSHGPVIKRWPPPRVRKVCSQGYLS